MSGTLDGNESDSECRLLKYRQIDKHLIDSLVKSSLWCAKPDTLNDPFDCKIELREAMRRAHSLVTGNQKENLRLLLADPDELFSKHMEEGLWRVGICSFSRFGKYRSASLQWAHYADGHKGVRLLYRIPRSFINDRIQDWNVSKELIDRLKVNYENDVLTNWLARTDLTPNSIYALARCYFTTKSPAWKYEREVRIIRREPGYLKLPLGYLEQVCFGLDTPQEDVERVEKLAREHCGCKNFYKMMRTEKSDFGMRAVRL